MSEEQVVNPEAGDEEQQPLVVQKIQEQHPDAILDVSDARGELTITVCKEGIYELMAFLKATQNSHTTSLLMSQRLIIL